MTVVVVAVDGTAACHRAALAAPVVFPDSRFVVATVVDRPGPIGIPGSERAAVWEATRSIALDSARRVAEEESDAIGPRASPLVLSGEPVGELCALARRVGASAVVVGSIGGRAMQGLRGPCVGTDLLERAPCAVIDLGGP